MRVLCQRIAIRANHDDGESGKFCQGRFKVVKFCDEAALLACSVYVDQRESRADAADGHDLF
jgi:hypothetical protein